VISDRSFQALKKHAEDKQRSEKDRS